MKLQGQIILIDDEHYEKEFIQDVLRRLNYEIDLVYFDNPKDGLHYIQSTKKEIFLIISDIHMGRFDGIRLKQMLNEDENTKLKSIPFVFTTSNATDANIREAYRHNIQGFFSKSGALLGFISIF